VSLHYRGGDLEIMLVEVAPEQWLSDVALQGRSSWHLVLDGQAVFECGNTTWEVLPEVSLYLDDPGPCRIVNPSHERLRLLSVVEAGGSDREERE